VLSRPAAIDVHEQARGLQLALNSIKADSKIGYDDRLAIIEFDTACAAEGLSPLRRIHYLRLLAQLARNMGRPLKDADKQDVVKLLSKLEGRGYSEWAMHDFKVALKKYYRWLRGLEDYPPEVKWIKTTTRNNHKKLPEEVLTEADIRALVEAADNPRDRAFVLVLYESGCRAGEILSARVKQVEFHEHGARLIVAGKTGMRRVRLVASAPLLATWLESHPDRENPDSPLWTGIEPRAQHQALRYPAVRAMFKRLAKRSGVKKRVYPHIFRHSRASHLATHLTEAQMKGMFGWTQGSDMAATYVHLSGRDVDSALLKLHGVEAKEEKEREEAFKVRKCFFCGYKNSPTSGYCSKCGRPLSLEAAERAEKDRSEADVAMSRLLQDSKVQSFLFKKIRELGIRMGKAA